MPRNETEVSQTNPQIERAVADLRAVLWENGIAFGAAFVIDEKDHRPMLMFAQALPPEMRIAMLSDMETAIKQSLEYFRKVN